jgi:FixJ family two-component response regulator
MNDNATIFVIDDDPAVRDSLKLLLEQENYNVETFENAGEFLAEYNPTPYSCAIVDVRMPGIDGFQLQAELTRRGNMLPVIFLTGHGDIPLSVRAIKMGALDFLTKPVRADAILATIRTALMESERLSKQVDELHSNAARLSSLTEREQEVMALAINGLNNKLIARSLGISHRTVEIHKARLLKKAGVDNLFELARIVDTNGFRA